MGEQQSAVIAEQIHLQLLLSSRRRQRMSALLLRRSPRWLGHGPRTKTTGWRPQWQRKLAVSVHARSIVASSSEFGEFGASGRRVLRELEF